MSDRIEALLSEGLGHFVKGDNASAVACWEAVLSDEPANARAREFMAYVRSTSPPGAVSPPPAAAPTPAQAPPPVVAEERMVALPPLPPPPQPVEAAVMLPGPTPAPTTPVTSENAIALPPPPAIDMRPPTDMPSFDLDVTMEDEPSSSQPTSGRMNAVAEPSKSGEWFRDVVQTQGAASPLPNSGFTPPPMTPGVAPMGAAGFVSPPFTPVPDPLLQQVLNDMRHASQALPLSSASLPPLPSSPPPPPSFTPPAPAPAPTPDRGANTLARGASLFGDITQESSVVPGNTPAPAMPPSGPWEAVMSPAPVGAPSSSTDSDEIEVAVEEDANADGLGSLWGGTPAKGRAAAPVTPVPGAAVVSPWDEGAMPTSGVVDLDRTEKGGPRTTTGKHSSVPRAGNVPGQPTGPADVKTRCATMMARVKELHDLGDFSGSLEIVEKVLELDPKNAEARDYMERNEETLLKMYESKLGNLERTPRMQMSPDQVIWLNLHHKAGFVLSRVDGMATFEDVLSLSAMPRLDTVRILAQLLQAGVITA